MPPRETERLLTRVTAAITDARHYQAKSDSKMAEECCQTARQLLDEVQQALAERLDSNRLPESHR